MKVVTVGLLSIAFGFAAQASITSVGWNSYDPTFENVIYWNGGSGSGITYSTMAATQTGAGSVGGYIYTSDPNDPTLTLGNNINNDTGFTWTGYNVDVSMNVTFSIANAIVSTPGGWTASILQPTLVGGVYTGHINYLAGTPVVNGQSLNFSYDITFSNGTQFGFSEDVTPVPEPGSLTIVGLLCGGWMFAKKRRQA
jgi:hypothetical protein